MVASPQLTPMPQGLSPLPLDALTALVSIAVLLSELLNSCGDPGASIDGRIRYSTMGTELLLLSRTEALQQWLTENRNNSLLPLVSEGAAL